MSHHRHNWLDRVRRFYRLPEHQPEYQWMHSRTYQRRREQVKTGWIIAGLLMLGLGSIGAVLIIAAFATFMSLAFLEYDQ
ncbi:hypothetical protein GCM10011297_18650 [Bacterioplanes sanyensis]|uniref:hypothetical protein n=1 Tax=Bacterioplanes sanyensis TaxID=1249553 RepID=UPI001673963D|nr:hypothetical protein [Bacterioplanes sanyensis]GGY46093.1 hypothetical protein GCM10011297_18650 [Bacterioplanes sanyensis]